MSNDYDYCIECGCDLTHRDDGNDTCCWCLERRFSLISITQEEKTDGGRFSLDGSNFTS